MKLKNVELRMLFLVSCNYEFFMAMLKMLAQRNVRVNEERLFDYLVNECNVDLRDDHRDGKVLSYVELSRLSSFFNYFVKREKELSNKEVKEVKEVKEFIETKCFIGTKEVRVFKKTKDVKPFSSFKRNKTYKKFLKDKSFESISELFSEHKHLLDYHFDFVNELRNYHIESKQVNIQLLDYIFSYIYNSNVKGMNDFNVEDLYCLFDTIRFKTNFKDCSKSDIALCVLKYNVSKLLENCLK